MFNIDIFQKVLYMFDSRKMCFHKLSVINIVFEYMCLSKRLVVADHRKECSSYITTNR